MSGIEVILVLLAILAALVVGAFVLVFLIVPVFKAIGWIVRQILRFIGGEIADIARAIGALVTALFLVPLVVGTVVIGRWSATAHYGRAFRSEVGALLACLYRIVIGHPIRLVGLGAVVEGIERRLPEVVAAAPGVDRPRGKAGQFDGYTIIGSLPNGGSGARLYVAEPDPVKAAALAKAGHDGVRQVVIKSFVLAEGSSLPQIVRESRSLDAAKNLRLILDHELAADRFFYVMRYVPGESLTLTTRRLHAGSPPGGLGDPQLRLALGYAADVVSTLDHYHAGGLWHKDVKPDNIIVHAETGRATLVDFGLLSSLRSAMTLTTHGTEYFRDPELVRLALKGVKVHEVDGTKFDVYAAGAVLYSMIEDSFPAHGVLSQVSRRCPEAVKWIIRRAMTDYDKRYASPREMLGDLRSVAQSPDPFAVRPADLPSMAGASIDAPVAPPEGHVEPRPVHPSPAGAPTFAQAAAGFAAAAASVAQAPFRGSGHARTPRIKVTNWWTGESFVEPEAGTPSADSPPDWAYAARAWAHNPAHAGVRHEPGPRAGRRTAEEQLRSAARRVEGARQRAAARAPFRTRAANYSSAVNGGAVGALLVGAVVLGAFIWGSAALSRSARGPVVIVHSGPGIATEWEQAAADFEARMRQSAEAIDSGQKKLADATAQAASKIDRHVRGVSERIPPVKPSRSAGPSRDDEPATHEPVSGVALVVSDVLQPYSPAAGRRIEHIVGTLSSLGLTVRGNVPGVSDPGDPDEGVELTARARLVLGQTPIDSADARGRLAAWLAANPDSADVVVWVSPVAGDAGAMPQVTVFAPAPADDAPDRGRTASLLRTVGRAMVEPRAGRN